MRTLAARPASPAPDATYFRRLYVWALGLYAIVLWPIIQAQAYYIDDLGRAESGFMGWSQDGRPLSNVLMEAFNLGTPLTDMAPLTQVAAIALLAFGTVRLARHFELHTLAVALLVAFPLGASPFYLENLSYRFDALPMAAAVVLALIAVTMAVDGVRRWAWGALLLLASLCFYQPALNVFIVYAVAEALFLLRRQASWRAILGRAALRIGQLGLASIAYTVVMAWKVQGRYAETHGQLAGAAPLEALGRNLGLFWGMVSEALVHGWGGVLTAYLVVGAVMAIGLGGAYAWRAWRSQDRAGAVWGLILAVVIPCVLTVAPWGPMLVLDKPVFNPRIMVGFGALLSTALLAMAWALPATRLKAGWQNGVLAVPAVLLVMFAFIYGNALRLQSEMEARVATSVSDDMARIAAAHPDVERYLIQGSIERPPIVDHYIAKYPLIGRLVPRMLGDYWGWADAQLRMYGMQMKSTWGWNGPLPSKDRVCGLTPEVIASHYRIYVVDRLAVLVFPQAGQCNQGADGR